MHAAPLESFPLAEARPAKGDALIAVDVHIMAMMDVWRHRLNEAASGGGALSTQPLAVFTGVRTRSGVAETRGA